MPFKWSVRSIFEHLKSETLLKSDKVTDWRLAFQWQWFHKKAIEDRLSKIPWPDTMDIIELASKVREEKRISLAPHIDKTPLFSSRQ